MAEIFSPNFSRPKLDLAEILAQVPVPPDNPLANAMAMGVSDDRFSQKERDHMQQIVSNMQNHTFSTIEEAQQAVAVLGEGTVMPVRDEAGEIMGWQVRKDVPQSGMAVPDALEMARRIIKNPPTNEQNY